MIPCVYTSIRAALMRVHFGEPFEPCDDGERVLFLSSWCWQCARFETVEPESGVIRVCPILEAGAGFDAPRPLPGEWLIGEKGQPVCTGWVELGQPVRPARCPHTRDMFGEPNP